MVELLKRYPMQCCACGKKLEVAPSLAMQFGHNSGHGDCPGCGAFLHLEITPDMGGSVITSQLFDDYLVSEGIEPATQGGQQ